MQRTGFFQTWTRGQLNVLEDEGEDFQNARGRGQSIEIVPEDEDEDT